MRRANGSGHITKLSGNRRRPYAIRKIVGWTDKGTPKYQYISYHKTQREAERALNAYINDPYTISKKTLKDVYDEWIALQDDKKSEGTMKAYLTAIKKLEPLHDVKMAQIDRIMLQNYYDNLEGTKNTSKKVKSLLGNLIKYAVKSGIMPMSALSLHKAIDFSGRAEGKKTPHKRIPKEIVDNLWTRTENETVKQILLYIYTGCRYEDLYNLLPENCYPDHIEIVEAKTEAGKRIVPLCDKILKLLPIEPIPHYDTFNKRFKKILPGYHIHDTRHTFISLMTEAGVDSRLIKIIVGHKSADITDLYTHITLEAMLEAVNKI